MGSGGESARKDRRTLIINAVRRSHCLECSEIPRVCEMAVLPMRGTLGMKALRIGTGEERSILVNLLAETIRRGLGERSVSGE